MFGGDEPRRTTLMRPAAIPRIKTLEQFDWSCAGGAPKKKILQLALMAIVRNAKRCRGVSWGSADLPPRFSPRWGAGPAVPAVPVALTVFLAGFLDGPGPIR
jgi:hypothetical protein